MDGINLHRSDDVEAGLFEPEAQATCTREQVNPDRSSHVGSGPLGAEYWIKPQG
jgi:hypothetical protein